MDSNRRSVRHLESENDSSRTPTNDLFRASTVDSGRGTMPTSERTSAVDSITTNGASSSLSRDTPLDQEDDHINENFDQNKPIRIRRTPVLSMKCYEQAFVSHIDHPSAFFLQLAHFEERYRDLQKQINEYYSNNPKINASSSWKYGDYCIVKYTKDNQFYRARIIAVPQMTNIANKYDVVYLDYGNWEKVDSINIYPIRRKFTFLPAQAVPCSLAKALPYNGTVWSDQPKAIELFEKLVFEKFVDATFYPKSSRDYWPLSFVDLRLSSTKSNIHEYMKNEGLIREVSNEKIFHEFHHLLRPTDYIIYSIPYEGEENDDNDD
ncbi:unnamed protein product [Rotaria sp. Silwood1]|nr:unnamed protein product [Rotaria sp. Silwood1]CAF4722003.1 unnamed protein product [Rotaria sp. Silwood1]